MDIRTAPDTHRPHTGQPHTGRPHTLQPEPLSRPKRGRPKILSDNARRAAILAKAREIFLDRGYAGTTTERVAEACGMSKRTIYRLFSSKADLFSALVDDHRRTMLALPLAPDQENLPLDAALAAIFRLDIDIEEERRRMAFVRITLTEAPRHPEIGEALHRHGIAEARRLLADWLTDQRARGRLSMESPMGAARMLMDMMFGAPPLRPGSPDQEESHADRIAHQEHCIRLFLGGTVPRDSFATARPDTLVEHTNPAFS
ncbi:MAG: TetR/AcrR family transcriptional regulator [Rhodospirillum sp.]|nr:TetR/AcrR family transcriptional regulator [Rhodospirillum sp.]MCF8490934.1 TetR/AcrR family transcriptional regulator [Rhodospirillum sp.]MCF8499063.1 TetR/AcrR family transcriptional regulator [Rhodospirillum sp.]